MIIEYLNSGKNLGVRHLGNSPHRVERPQNMLQRKAFPRDVKKIQNETDRRIIGLLEANPNLTQVELGRQIGVSQSTVASRLSKLEASELLVKSQGINYEVLGLQMCRIDVLTSKVEDVLEWALKCPLFVNGARGLGNEPLTLYFVAEDVKTFRFIVDEHLRKIPGVTDLRFSLISDWARPYSVLLNLDYNIKEVSPCGVDSFCPKCPSNPEYNGKLWNNERLRDLLASNGERSPISQVP